MNSFEPITANMYDKEFVFLFAQSEWSFEDDLVSCLRLFKTSDARGMGVYTTVGIDKGAFVIEYAGELDDLLCSVETTKAFIDPFHRVDLARFINRHCLPNYLLYLSNDGFKHRIDITAGKKITAGEELTFKYSDVKTYFQNFFTCTCGAKRRITIKM